MSNKSATRREDESWELDTATLSFIAHRRQQQAKSKTISAHEQNLRHIRRALGGDWDLAQLSRRCQENVLCRCRTCAEAAIFKYTAGISLAASSTNKIMKSLRAVVHFGHSKALIALPAPFARLREVEPELTLLAAEDEPLLLASARNPIEELLLILALDTGQRHAELLHLHWNDADLAAGIVQVRKKACAAHRHTNGVWIPKTYEERKIPLTRRAHDTLKRLYRSNDSDWIFAGTDPDRPRKNFAFDVQGAYRRAGLYKPGGRTGLHQCRRTWITRLLDPARRRPISLEQGKRWGGWKNLKTMQRYIGAIPRDERSAIDPSWNDDLE